MVPVPKTVVDVHTMMIELFHAFLAHHAMESPGRLDDLAVEAKVFKVYVLLICNLKQVYHVQFMFHVARRYTSSQQIECEAQE
jgi:hypothetical protein